jgi:hypothetical protein
MLELGRFTFFDRFNFLPRFIGVGVLWFFWASSSGAVVAPVPGHRNQISMGGAYRMETSTSGQVTEPYLGLSLTLGRRWTEFDFNLEYQEIRRQEAGNLLLSVGSADREIFGYLDRGIDALCSDAFRTAFGFGAGVLTSSVRTRFQNTITEASGQADLLLKAGLSFQYVIESFQIGLDGRIHYARGVSDRVTPEILLRFGSRF